LYKCKSNCLAICVVDNRPEKRPPIYSLNKEDTAKKAISGVTDQGFACACAAHRPDAFREAQANPNPTNKGFRKRHFIPQNRTPT